MKTISQTWLAVVGASTILGVFVLGHFVPGLRATDTGAPALAASNLRDILVAIRAYHSHRAGIESLPDDQATLLASLVESRLVSARTVSDEDWPTWNPGEPAFYVVMHNVESTDPHAIVLYEHPQNYDGRGGNICYADGRVKWVREPEFGALVSQLTVASIVAVEPDAP